jgi:hypothetical protein
MDRIEKDKGYTHSEKDIEANKDCFCRLEWNLEIEQ